MTEDKKTEEEIEEEMKKHGLTPEDLGAEPREPHEAHYPEDA